MKLTDRELKHLKTVIDYLYRDERRDYECENRPNDHIFVSVLGLQEFLRRESSATQTAETNHDSTHGPRRSTPGQGQQCFVYVLGRADEHADSIVSRYGKITAGCGKNLNEDFAETTWPVVVKVSTLAETFACKDWGSPGEDVEIPV